MYSLSLFNQILQRIGDKSRMVIIFPPLVYDFIVIEKQKRMTYERIIVRMRRDKGLRIAVSYPKKIYIHW